MQFVADILQFIGDSLQPTAPQPLDLQPVARAGGRYQVRLIARNINCIARRLKSLVEGVYAAKLYYGHS